MLQRVVLAGCLLAGASCLFADDPVQQAKAPLGGVMTAGVSGVTAPPRNEFRKVPDTAQLLWDNGKVNYHGVRVASSDLISPAALIFDNGGDNYTNGYEITMWRMAEDFVLGAESKVERIDFSVLDTNAGNNLGNWEGTADWYIYADAGGAPGNLIASGEGVNITTVFDQMTNGWDFWDFSMALDNPQCLGAGTYWFGIHLNRDSGCVIRHNLYWGITDLNGSPEHFQDLNCTGNFTGASNELSFALSGTVGCDGGGEVCLDFEAAGPCVFAQTGPLRDLYSGLGITFAGPGNLDGGAILDECGGFGINARSGTNFLAFNRNATMNNGGVARDPETVLFDADASAVSVWVSGGIFDARWRMDAYDAGGGLITSSSIGTGVGVWGELAVSGSGIRSVVVTETLGVQYFVWDDFCVILGSAPGCLDLSVTTLVSGQSAIWDVSNATPGAEVVVVYGHQPGHTAINGFGGYCADFGITGVGLNRVICRKVADGAGMITCRRALPNGISGVRVLSQAAESGTCPDTCMSNLDDQVVG